MGTGNKMLGCMLAMDLHLHPIQGKASIPLHVVGFMLWKLGQFGPSASSETQGLEVLMTKRTVIKTSNPLVSEDGPSAALPVTNVPYP